MKLIAPDYLPSFRCIAGACRHSCCVGWEIDVDEDSARRYQAMQGELGKKIRESIDWKNRCFILDEQERCPFLNQQGLCDLILAAGEESLCQICSDHPRFRNELNGRVEMGLGLCCEAAAELILTKEAPVTLITLEDDRETDDDDLPFLLFRQRLFALIQDRSKPVEQRVDALLSACQGDLPVDYAAWHDFLLKLERLDQAWETMLARLREPEKPLPGPMEIPLEQLMCYLLFRHLAPGMEDGRLRERAVACGILWKLLRRMLRDDLQEIARLFSSEIEYSDENMEAILEVIGEILPD